jgi:predicted N-acetyltransferase YhbS
VVEIRAATADDDAAVLELLQASMGWVPDDQYARFFTWKHRESPFGPSPAWVAVEGRRIVGFRTFLRWQFSRDGEIVDAVRAVDTATHPDHQGRGIFSRLTYHALDELRAAGVAFVFNTPNDNSRPGYMKMGWKLVRRVPVAARPRSPQALVRLVRARTPADKWSTECPTGVAAPEALADTGDAALAPLLDEAASGGLRTHRTPAYLRWRYGFPPLRYRVLTAPGGPADGLVVFRLRRRGAATEAAVCEVLVPGGSVRTTRRLLGRMLRDSGADYAVILGSPRPRLGFLPVPGQGPTLVWRGVKDTAPPPPEAWNLALGDIELL